MSESKKVKILVIVSLILVISFAVEGYRGDPRFKYNEEGKRIYEVGVHKERCRSPLDAIFGRRPRGRPYVVMTKSYLKNLGTGVATYFADGTFDDYPENPNDMELAVEKLRLKHLRGTDKEMPYDWSFPDTWDEFNKSEVPFIFVRSPGEEYEGSANKVIFIIKEGYGALKGYYHAVYEDAHVDTISREEAEKLWKKVLRGNDK